MKVYNVGGFIILESSVTNKIDVEAFSFSFNGSNTVLIDQENEETYQAETSNIQDQAGAAIGNEAAVNTYLKSLKPASGGGGGSSDTTAANQVILIDQTAAKKIGYVLDIAVAGTPPPYTDLVELIQTIDGNSVSYPISNLSAADTEDLAQIFNDLQKRIYYSALDSQKLYFVPVEDAVGDISEILFEDGNEGQLPFSSPYAETTDTPTGALHELVTLTQQQTAALKPIELTPEPSRLVNPSSEILTGFKYLVFSCDGANNSITVTQNGNSVTYPQPNLDGSLLRGYELPLSKVPYTNSITFNGTGTVDILKID